MKRPILFICLLLGFQEFFAQNITLESLMAAPHLTHLTVSPTGDKIIWVENVKGVRNIVYAAPPQYKAEILTDYDKDDGIEISHLEWAQNSQTFFFVKGNAPQVRGTQPHNPAHIMEGTAPMIWQLKINNKGLTKIGNGSNPTLSPDGKKLVFTRGGQIFIKNAEDTAAAKQLCHVRNGASSLRWSPDGSQLAFVSFRGEHSFIGVFNFKNNDYEFINPSVDSDIEPTWSPDGKQLAYLKIPGSIEPNVSFFPIREGEPWSIVVADVSNAKATTIFTADKGMGSVYWNHTGKQQLYWTNTDKIIFIWEKTGWQQLYAISSAGGKPTSLTKGNFEVDEVKLSLDKKQVIFNSNEKDIDLKHIWMANTEGSPKNTALTSGKTAEWNIQHSDDSKTLFYIRSDARTPSQVYMHNTSDGSIRQISDLPNYFPKNQLVEPEPLTLTSKDGSTFNSQVFYPKNVKKDKSHPAAIFVHGGSRRQMLLAYNSSWYYANAYHLCQYFASQGFVAMSINYRSGIGYGRDFREAQNYGASGNSEFQDLEAAGEWLKKNPSVSASKIGVWGGSYGGYMTAMALSRRSDLFAAGADIHGVHNWNTEIPTFMPQYDSLRFSKHAQIAYKASPIYYIDGWKSPVLLAHGDDDQNVPFSETEMIARVLRQKGVEFEQIIVPDEVHSFLRYKSWLTIYSAVSDFFDRKLKNQHKK